MEERLPGGTKVAIVSVASPSTAFSSYVIDSLEAALVDKGTVKVVDRANLEKIRAEQGFHLSGDVSDESAKEIGKMLGAGAIVTGSLLNIGDEYRLTLKAINIESAEVAVSYPADIANDKRVQALLASGGGSVVATSRPAAAPAQAATAPAKAVAAPAQAAATPAKAVAAPVAPVAAAAPAVTAAPAKAPAAPVVAAPVVPAAPPAPTTYKIGGTGPAGGLVFYPAAQKENAKPAPVTRDYKVGDTGPAGGTIFYVNPSAGDWKYLEAAPARTEVKTFWASEVFPVDGILDIRAVGTGKSNTEFIMRQAVAKGGGFDWAAEACDALTVNGYDDWFLPSMDELHMMYGNLGRKGLGDFKAEWYWSSTPYSDGIGRPDARAETFSDGAQSGNSRYDRYIKYCVRAIRQF
jgi:hypothetical protein